MRILDRYVVRQLVPVWIWCLLIFVSVTILIDLFGHLEEILRYHLPPQTIWLYYLNFAPLVFVQASPLALLLSTAFITTRLVRYQELLAMHVGGMSLLRASVPFLFVGWLVSALMFVVNERVVPQTSAMYERLRIEAFRESQNKVLENVATLDRDNRLYHARLLDLAHHELEDLTVLEHDAQNRPTRSVYAPRAIFTRHGWLLLGGRISTLSPRGTLVGDPMPFVDRLMPYPVTIESFRQPIMEPETLRFGELRELIKRLRTHGITNVRRYAVELAAKVTLPLTNLLVCFIAFVGSTRRQGRTNNLRGLGTSLGWGLLYYIGVAISHGLGKTGFLPVLVAVWLPHAVAVWACVRVLRRAT